MSKKTSKKKSAALKAHEHIGSAEIECKYEFSQEEQSSLGKELAAKGHRVKQLREDFKASASDWKSKIKIAEAEHAQLETSVSNGYDFRKMKVKVHYDFKAGTKRFIRADNDAVVREEDMTDYDRQQTFFRSWDADQKRPKTTMEAAFEEAEKKTPAVKIVDNDDGDEGAAD